MTEQRSGHEPPQGAAGRRPPQPEQPRQPEQRAAQARAVERPEGEISEEVLRELRTQGF